MLSFKANAREAAPSILTRSDMWTIADRLYQQHGSAAVYEASAIANGMGQRGDAASQSTWLRIAEYAGLLIEHERAISEEPLDRIAAFGQS